MALKITSAEEAITVSNLITWVHSITGREIDVAEFMETGERVFNLKRLFNTRAGVSRKDDFLPPRFLTLNRKYQLPLNP